MEINPNALGDRDFLAFLCNEEISPDTTTAAIIRAETLDLLAKLRAEAEAEVERLLALIDRIDGDCDLEPSLGFVPAGQVVDAEDEHDGREPDHDDEDDGTAEEEPDREPEEPEHPGYVLNRADIALRRKLRASRARPLPIGRKARLPNGASVTVTAHVD